MGELVVAVCAKVWKSAGFLVCGGAAEADLWRGGGQGFERADSWRCGACQELREWQEAEAVKASVWGEPGGCSGRFRVSTIDAQEQAAGRALRVFAALVPAGGRAWNLARRSADHDAKIEPAARKMKGVRWSHLMHSMNQVHKMSNSELESALKG